jgi:hypothetical protein
LAVLHPCVVAWQLLLLLAAQLQQQPLVGAALPSEAFLTGWNTRQTLLIRSQTQHHCHLVHHDSAEAAMSITPSRQSRRGCQQRNQAVCKATVTLITYLNLRFHCWMSHLHLHARQANPTS